MSVEALRTYLQSVPPGPVEKIDSVAALLAGSWVEIDVVAGDAADQPPSWHKPTPSRIPPRVALLHAACLSQITKMIWEPPVLTFALERLVRTAKGSKVVELLGWAVDIDARTAAVVTGRQRTVPGRQNVPSRTSRPECVPAAPVNPAGRGVFTPVPAKHRRDSIANELAGLVNPIAAQLVRQIVACEESSFLEWISFREVVVLATNVFPPGSCDSATLTRRRSRLRDEIEDALLSSGWRKAGLNRFRRVPEGD
jgi:hypothetical protein